MPQTLMEKEESVLCTCMSQVRFPDNYLTINNLGDSPLQSVWDQLNCSIDVSNCDGDGDSGYDTSNRSQQLDTWL